MAEQDDMSTSSPSVASKSSPSDQARIRKERREAKLKNGNARLNKIIGLGGGLPRGTSPFSPLLQHLTFAITEETPDPDEVDISVSQHYFEPAKTQRVPSNGSSPGSSSPQVNDAQLRQMFQNFDTQAPSPSGAASPFGIPAGGAGFPGFPGMAGAPGQEDPMMKMLQQMMGGMGGTPGEGMDGMPSFPGLNMGAAQGEAAKTDPYAFMWTVVHALFALGLGLYIAVSCSFSGTKHARESTVSEQGVIEGGAAIGAHFFYLFATIEVLLLSTRFWLEKGKEAPTGWVGTVMGFLPVHIKSYVEVALRYGKIWSQVSGDALVVLFMLGAGAWVRGGI